MGGRSKRTTSMSQEELLEILWTVYNGIDIAHHDITVWALMKTAPKWAILDALENFLQDAEGHGDWDVDEETTAKARKLVKPPN